MDRILGESYSDSNGGQHASLEAGLFNVVSARNGSSGAKNTASVLPPSGPTNRLSRDALAPNVQLMWIDE